MIKVINAKVYKIEEITQDDLNNLALERNTLAQENKRLSEQLELLTSKLDEYDLIVDERNQLKKQLENSIKVNIADHKYASECEDKVVILEAYQKEFIKYLEDEIHTIETTFSQINGNYGLMNEKLEALKEVLQKYEEIMNGTEQN